MATDESHNRDGGPPESEFTALVTDHLAGKPAATNRLAAYLTDTARNAVQAFLKSRADETQDLVQESVLAVMDYLKKRGSFEGDIGKFTATVARNRCRNHLIWRKRHHKLPLESVEPFLATSHANPLDEILGHEQLAMVQSALNHLDQKCRKLLTSLYIEELPIEQIRQREALKSVQSVYYRRAQCLKKAGEILKKWLSDCSSNGRDE